MNDLSMRPRAGISVCVAVQLPVCCNTQAGIDMQVAMQADNNRPLDVIANAAYAATATGAPLIQSIESSWLNDWHGCYAGDRIYCAPTQLAENYFDWRRQPTPRLKRLDTRFVAR